jgi:hypothetical protein
MTLFILEKTTRFFQFLLNPILFYFNYWISCNYILNFDIKTFEASKTSFEIAFCKTKKIDEKYSKVISKKVIYFKKL